MRARSEASTCMSERPTPDLTILETRVYRGAERLVLRPGDPPRRRPRRRSRSSRPTRSPASSTICSTMLPGLARALLLARAPRRLRRAPQGGHLARARRRARRAGAPAGGRPRHPSRQDPQAPGEPGRYNVVYGVRRGERRPGRRPARRTPGQPPGRARTRTSTSTPSSRRFILRAERTAFGPSTQAILDEAVARDIPWIRLNQHSLVQLGQGVHQQADPGDDDVQHQRDRGRHRLRQGPHHPAARRRRAAGAQAGVGAHRRPGRRGRPTDRLPGRRQAARRQPRPRRRASTCRTPTTVRAAFPVARGPVPARLGDRRSPTSPASDYRCLVIDGRLAAVAERVPAHVDRRRRTHHRATSSS